MNSVYTRQIGKVAKSRSVWTEREGTTYGQVDDRVIRSYLLLTVACLPRFCASVGAFCFSRLIAPYARSDRELSSRMDGRRFPSRWTGRKLAISAEPKDLKLGETVRRNRSSLRRNDIARNLSVSRLHRKMIFGLSYAYSWEWKRDTWVLVLLKIA